MSARWSQDLQALATRTGLRMDTVIRKATFDLFRSVALKSPVDTGRFRANWNVSYGAPDLTTTESNNQARAIQQAQQALTLPVGGVVTMSNGLKMGSGNHRMGTQWIGENGWGYADRGRIEASNAEWTRESFDRGPKKAYKVKGGHHRNWVEGILTGTECICPAETGHRSATPGHLA